MSPALGLAAAELIAFFLTALLSYRLTFAMIRLSKRFGFIDEPQGRKAHEAPTPVLGGAAVLLAFWITVAGMFCVAVIAGARSISPHQFQSIVEGAVLLWPKLCVIFAGSIWIWLVGVIDDRFNLPPAAKLLGQAVAAGFLMSAGLSTTLFAGGAVSQAVTFVWILLILNAFNFIDSIDGHCAGVAMTSCLMFFALLQIVDQPLVSLFVVTLTGALLGFIPHNFRPAKIFLGDNGSLFLGYSMAAITLLSTYTDAQHPVPVTPFIPLLMFGVPIYDTVSVVLVRLLRGIPPWKGDRNHFAHRLKRLGMNDKAAVSFSIFVTGTLGLVALLATQIRSLTGEILVLLLFFSIIGIIALLEYYSAVRIQVIEELARQNRRRKDDIRSEEERRL